MKFFLNNSNFCKISVLLFLSIKTASKLEQLLLFFKYSIHIFDKFWARNTITILFRLQGAAFTVAIREHSFLFMFFYWVYFSEPRWLFHVNYSSLLDYFCYWLAFVFLFIFLRILTRGNSKENVKKSSAIKVRLFRKQIMYGFLNTPKKTDETHLFLVKKKFRIMSFVRFLGDLTIP